LNRSSIVNCLTAARSGEMADVIGVTEVTSAARYFQVQPVCAVQPVSVDS
jgi:hypothetical protein